MMTDASEVDLQDRSLSEIRAAANSTSQRPFLFPCGDGFATTGFLFPLTAMADTIHPL